MLNSNAFSLVQKICEAISITKRSRLQMVKYGITSVVALHSVEDRASNYELSELRTDLVQNLTIASEWLHDNPSFDILRKFDESLFQEILSKQRLHDFARFYIKDYLGSRFDKDNLKHHNHVDSTPGLLDIVIDKVIAATMMSPNLKDKCGNFDYKNFIGKAVRDLHDRLGQKDNDGKKYVISAPMQSGKSGVKGILQSLAAVLEMPTIVLTKGVDESIDLSEKLKDLSEGTKTVKREHVVVGEYLV